MTYKDWEEKYSGNTVVIEYESGCGWWSVFKPVKGCSHYVLKDGFKNKEKALEWAHFNGWMMDRED